MPDIVRPSEFTADLVSARRDRLAAVRQHAAQLLAAAATGIQVGAALSEGMDRFLIDVFNETFQRLEPQDRQRIETQAAIIAVGGTGRGDLAPYSDADLLFLYRPPVRQAFEHCVSPVVRDYWDAGLKVGHSLRTEAETIALALQDSQVATALVESRLLWGDAALFEHLRRTFRRRVVAGRLKTFIQECVRAREAERRQHGSTTQQLEPDVKRSLGGLRDVQLVRWIGFAYYGTADVESIRLQGGLSRDDARSLLASYEFLLRIRIDLHLAQGRPHDVLTREEQLRITQHRGIEATAGMRAVERFMQDYFRHSTAVADIAQRFVARHQPRSLLGKVAGSLMTHRADGIFKVSHESIDVFPWSRNTLCRSLEQILRLYHAALLYGVSPSPELVEKIKQAVPALETNLSAESCRTFLQILGCTGSMDGVLRQMYDIGLLEVIVPPMTHARCLLQFNQYHHYTVDEHTLRTIEAAIGFERDDGPVGAAYRDLHHKEILHLALLLHDLGKGYGEDHSEVGRRIAHDVGERLQLPDHHRETLEFLVHKHLLMPHLAFRRNVSDPEVLLEFTYVVGSPERLQMLYVLSAADLSGVGPGVWTEWKAELITELYDNAMAILSGRDIRAHEEVRFAQIRQAVRHEMLPPDELQDAGLRNWLDRQLETLSGGYLSATPPPRIAADLRVMRRLGPAAVVIEGENLPQTGTVDLRIVADAELSEGIFHRISGVLTAKRLEILSAQISTTLDGTIVDSFRVRDDSFAGEVPTYRIEEIGEAIRQVLTRETTVEELFRRHKRFGGPRDTSITWHLPLRVVLDNDSSDGCTVVDVFAHDRPGLLYTISRTLYELGLSVLLAKISTHLDQVVDVFYVVDRKGRKIEDGDWLRAIEATLVARIEDFERDGHVRFAQ